MGEAHADGPGPLDHIPATKGPLWPYQGVILTNRDAGQCGAKKTRDISWIEIRSLQCQARRRWRQEDGILGAGPHALITACAFGEELQLVEGAGGPQKLGPQARDRLFKAVCHKPSEQGAQRLEKVAAFLGFIQLPSHDALHQSQNPHGGAKHTPEHRIKPQGKRGRLFVAREIEVGQEVSTHGHIP